MPGYFFAQAALVAAHGQLGGREAARDALQRLLGLKPDIARTARDEFGKWFVESELVEHLMDGLRKAGLDVATVEGAVVAPPVAEPAGPAAAQVAIDRRAPVREPERR